MTRPGAIGPHGARRLHDFAAMALAFGVLAALPADAVPVGPAEPTAAEPVAAEATALPAPQGTLDQLMRLLAQRRHSEADFRQVTSVTALNRPIESSGVLIYDAPDRLEQRTIRPRAQTAVLDHGVLTLRSGGRERSVPLAERPELAPLVDSVRALLAGDRAALERWYALQITGTIDRWQLRLEPRATRPLASLRNIEISGEGAAIHEVRLQQGNGDYSVMYIQPRE